MAKVTLPHRDPGSSSSADENKEILELSATYWKTKEIPLLIN